MVRVVWQIRYVPAFVVVFDDLEPRVVCHLKRVCGMNEYSVHDVTAWGFIIGVRCVLMLVLMLRVASNR